MHEILLATSAPRVMAGLRCPIRFCVSFRFFVSRQFCSSTFFVSYRIPSVSLSLSFSSQKLPPEKLAVAKINANIVNPAVAAIGM